MRVIRTPARQAHAVPDRAYRPGSPFDRGVMAQSRIVVEDPEPTPYNSTSQNDFRGETLYRCRQCGATVAEPDLDIHVCEEDE